MSTDCSERVPHLTPVGRDHVGGGWQPGGATELRHYFTSGEPLLGAARIFRVGQHAFKLLTDFDRLIKRPGTVRIQRDARLREALRQRGDRLCFFFTRQYAAFQLEVIKAIFFIRGFRRAPPRPGSSLHRDAHDTSRIFRPAGSGTAAG